MDKNAQPSNGYAQRCTKKSWRTVSDEAWEIMVLDKRDGPFRFVGFREIGGTLHDVWRGDGGKYYAQVHYGL